MSGTPAFPPNPRIPFRLEGDSAPLPPFRGKRVVVNVAVNVEYWPFDQPMPRAILPPPHGIRAVPDVPNFTWVEYGLRVGMKRLLDLCGGFGIRASNLSNAQICTHYPRLAEAMLKARVGIRRPRPVPEGAGDGGGRRGLGAREPVASCAASPASPCAPGSARGWARRTRTPELLRRHGIDLLHDWLVDDEPVWMTTAAGPDGRRCPTRSS